MNRDLIYKILVEPFYDLAVATITRRVPRPVIGWANWVLGGFICGDSLAACVRRQYD